MSLLHPEGSWWIAVFCIMSPLFGLCYRRMATSLERGKVLIRLGILARRWAFIVVRGAICVQSRNKAMQTNTLWTIMYSYKL